jgi:hypothetical protein
VKNRLKIDRETENMMTSNILTNMGVSSDARRMIDDLDCLSDEQVNGLCKVGVLDGGVVGV